MQPHAKLYAQPAGHRSVRFYEHHAQDARVRIIRDCVAQTLASSNANSVGVSGNNPIVLKVMI